MSPHSICMGMLKEYLPSPITSVTDSLSLLSLCEQRSESNPFIGRPTFTHAMENW